MNPRQRRGALLILLAGIGGIAIFVVITNYVSDVRSQVEPVGTVLQLTEDVAAFHTVGAGQVEEVDIPERWIPEGAMRSVDELTESSAASDLREGSYLQSGMLVEPIALPENQRELAIMVDAETGVAGKIRPGDRVDVFATFPGGEGPDGEEAASAEIVISGAQVVDVGQELVAQSEDDGDSRPTGIGADRSSVPVTFALDVDESLLLTYVESFASSVRLGLMAPDSDHELSDDERIYRRYDIDPEAEPEDGEGG